jgi:multidrug efflux pump subunit AcrA (membrane-fusion protein)
MTRFFILIVLSAFALVGAMLLILHGGRQHPAVADPEDRAIAVNTVHPRREALQRLVEQPGQIEGFERTVLYAKIPGYVRSYQVDIGDRINKDQLLAELWVPEFVEDVREKEATVGQDEAQLVLVREVLRAAEANVAKAEANVRLAEASRAKAEANLVRWRSQYKRDTPLVRSGAISVEDFEITTDQFKTMGAAKAESVAGVAAANAALAESKAQRDKAAADVQVAEARVRVSRAAHDRAAAILAYARIEAPYDGVVSRRGVDTGAYVQAPSAGKTGATPLFEVVRTDLVRIFVDVPESDAPFVKSGGSARVQVQALGEREFPGRVARSSWLLDGQTRTLRTEIDLPNPDGLFRPGMYANARLPVQHPNTLTLPSSAVFHQDDRDWVVRVEDGKAIWTPVRLGFRQEERVEVLCKQTRPTSRHAPGVWEDFTGSETIVRDNPSALADGLDVRIQSGELASAAITEAN